MDYLNAQGFIPFIEVARRGSIKADAEGKLVLPPFPGTPAKSDTDWALKLASA